MKKVFLKFVISICVISFAGAVIFSVVTRSIEDDFLEGQGIEKMSLGYSNEAFQQGSLKVISYKTTMIGRIHNTLDKKATVYLPYGYTSTQEYNIFYLMHGRGGSYKTWLGNQKHPREFKNILDNMIENGDIKPLIVVAPNLTYEYGSDDMIMEGTSHEIATDLMPAVEGQFNTFAKGITSDSFRLSREHRCIGGFSMGGSLTWHTLKDHIDYFRYFIPMSMATYYDNKGYSRMKSLAAAAELKGSLNSSGYTSKDFEVFAATGGMDHKGEATAMQVFDLADDKEFVYTDNYFGEGNITFKMWPGKWHSYKTSYPYIYNALIQFYGN
ncbi:MAG: hypothetical protein GX663_00635 [Clostridiales bacterium]|nr:hypothetical protein [Clostridiales bacterium]